MKKCISILLATAMVFSLVGCAGSMKQVQTEEEILQLAKEEGEVHVYSISTRMSEGAKRFEQKYGIKVIWENMDGGELISRVNTEVTNGTANVDVVLAQDSGRVQMELIDKGLLENYIPKSAKYRVAEENQNPLVHQYINKLFISNSNWSGEEITNVWQFVEEQNKGKLFFKDPQLEDVNMNFLTMLTAEDWAEKLEESYEDLYGEELVLSEGCENAGWEYIARLYRSVSIAKSDTEIANYIGNSFNQSNQSGLFVYSKVRYSEQNDLSLQAMLDIQPFVGFMYPVYILQVKDSKNSNAGKLLIDYLMTEEGFEPWQEDVGAYSTNEYIPVVKNDRDLEYWEEKLVVEDAIYVSQNIYKVSEFLNGIK